MTLADFDYKLPPDLIAQQPLAERGASRMLVVDRKNGTWQDAKFQDLPSYLKAGDVLVINDSRVRPWRLYGRRAGGTGTVEVLLLRETDSARHEWQALVRPGRRLHGGSVIEFDETLGAMVMDTGERGERTIRFFGDPEPYIEKHGHIPLPPYIRRDDTALDRERYQTVFSREPGSAAAPTAGLHFTPAALEACKAAGAAIARVTLHVGLGTFAPLHTEVVEEARLPPERYNINPAEWDGIQAARRRIAVGTTSTRTLESASRGKLTGDTSLFIYPGFQFQMVNALLTNFHLPQSSLLLLVCAFSGKDFALAAYAHAVKERYRFFSYGDCMLIV